MWLVVTILDNIVLEIYLWAGPTGALLAKAYSLMDNFNSKGREVEQIPDRASFSSVFTWNKVEATDSS